MSEVIVKPSRYNKLEAVSCVKAGAFGGPGTGKSVLWALCIIGLYQRWKITKPVLIFDSDKGASYLEPIFRFAGVPVEVNDTDFSLKGLTEDMAYAEKNCGAFLIDSLADPWEEFMRSYVKTAKGGRTYIDRADWPVLYQQWGLQFELRFKSLNCHAFWTSKPKAVYENQYDAEASEKRGKEVMTAQKVDDTATGGRARSAEFGPGLTVECYHKLVDGVMTREILVSKDRYFSLTGKTFSFKEPLTKDGKLDIATLVEKNVTFNSFLSHFENINPDVVQRNINMETRSGEFFQTDRRETGDDYYAMRAQTAEEIQNLLVMKFPSTSGAEKSAKVKIVLWVFGSSVWDSIVKTTPIHDFRSAAYKVKAIVSNDSILEGVIAWDGVETRSPALVLKIDETAIAIADSEKINPISLQSNPQPKNGNAFDQMVNATLAPKATKPTQSLPIPQEDVPTENVPADVPVEKKSKKTGEAKSESVPNDWDKRRVGLEKNETVTYASLSIDALKLRLKNKKLAQAAAWELKWRELFADGDSAAAKVKGRDAELAETAGEPAVKNGASILPMNSAAAETSPADAEKPYPDYWISQRNETPAGASLPWNKHTPLMLKATANTPEFRDQAIFEARYKLIEVYDKPLVADDKLFDELSRVSKEAANAAIKK